MCNDFFAATILSNVFATYYWRISHCAYVRKTFIALARFNAHYGIHIRFPTFCTLCYRRMMFNVFCFYCVLFHQFGFVLEIKGSKMLFLDIMIQILMPFFYFDRFRVFYNANVILSCKVDGRILLNFVQY